MATGTRKRFMIYGHHALPLPGWDQRSVWGLDRMEATYGLYAQLWRNGDSYDDGPRHSLSCVPDMPTLARRIAAAAGCTEDGAVDAILFGIRELEAEQGVSSGFK